MKYCRIKEKEKLDHFVSIFGVLWGKTEPPVCFQFLNHFLELNLNSLNNAVLCSFIAF